MEQSVHITHVAHQGGISYGQLGNAPEVHGAPGALERLVIPEERLVLLELELCVHQVDRALTSEVAQQGSWTSECCSLRVAYR